MSVSAVTTAAYHLQIGEQRVHALQEPANARMEGGVRAASTTTGALVSPTHPTISPGPSFDSPNTRSTNVIGTCHGESRVRCWAMGAQHKKMPRPHASKRRTSPTEYPNCLARTMTSIWNTYPAHRHPPRASTHTHTNTHRAAIMRSEPLEITRGMMSRRTGVLYSLRERHESRGPPQAAIPCTTQRPAPQRVARATCQPT